MFAQCSYDYDPNSPITRNVFANCQNKLEYAAVNMTSAEIIGERANYNLPNMGLTNWNNQRQNWKIMKRDGVIAKNYLTEEEISNLNKLVTMLLDYVENLAKKQIKISMQDWSDKIDNFLKFNEYEILKDFGKISHEQAKKIAEENYDLYKPIQEENYKSDFDKFVEDTENNKNNVLPKK